MSSHLPSSAPALDLQLQPYLRFAATRGRDVERVGPFLCTFHPTTDMPYVNYAIPDDGARPTRDEVAALVAAYDRRGRVPRLEYLPGTAPAVESALLDGGLAVEARLPAMTCAPDDLVEHEPPAGIALAVPRTDAELVEMNAVLHAAFGEDPPEDEEAEVVRQRAALAAGQLAIVAVDVETGAVVGGGVATVPRYGVTEIGGIGVQESHRRRGIAGAMTARLTRDAFAAAVTLAYLTPGDEGAHRVYARAGFADATTMLHVARP